MISIGHSSAALTRAIDADEMRRLVSIGFYGALNGQAEPALRLFDALGMLRPDQGFPYIGKALALMATGRPSEAARVLEDGLARYPGDDEMRVLLGVSLRVGNRGHHARAVLESLAVRDAQTAAVRFARKLIAMPL